MKQIFPGTKNKIIIGTICCEQVYEYKLFFLVHEWENFNLIRIMMMRFLSIIKNKNLNIFIMS